MPEPRRRENIIAIQRIDIVYRLPNQRSELHYVSLSPLEIGNHFYVE